MPIDVNLVAMMPHTVKIEPLRSVDAWGKPTYHGPPSGGAYQALVVHRVRKVLDFKGVEAVSNVTVYTNTVDLIEHTARLTLPSGYVPQQPRIVRVERQADEYGLHHTVIYA